MRTYETLTEQNAKPGLKIRDKYNPEWPEFVLAFRRGSWRAVYPFEGAAKSFIIYPGEFPNWEIVA